MPTIIMLILLVLVIATSCGVLYWFFRKLNIIEVELWGEKKKEATETAMATKEDNPDAESDDNKTE